MAIALPDAATPLAIEAPPLPQADEPEPESKTEPKTQGAEVVEVITIDESKPAVVVLEPTPKMVSQAKEEETGEESKPKIVEQTPPREADEIRPWWIK